MKEHVKSLVEMSMHGIVIVVVFQEINRTFLSLSSEYVYVSGIFTGR